MLVTTSPPAAEASNSSPSSSPHDRLEELAVALARSLPAPPPAGVKAGARRRASDPVPGRLRQLQAHLRAAQHSFEDAQASDAASPRSAEWVLDNHYVIEQAVRQLRENLPVGFYRRLPQVELEGIGFPRATLLAIVCVRLSESRLAIDQIVSFVNAFETLAPLRIGEIWALPLMLRLSILETLAAALARVTGIVLPPGPFPETIPLGPDERLDLPETDDETLVANSILSLRALATQDWKAFFESVSVVEEILRDDPADVYPRMDSPTRDRYRDVVEELAQGAPREEAAIAREAIQMAGEGDGPRTRHVGYYLIDDGVPALKERLAYREPAGAHLRQWLYGHALLAYLGPIILLTTVLTSLGWLYADAAGGTGWAIGLAALLSVLPASALAVDLVNGLVAQILPPKLLPRLNYRAGVPPECATMVVIPALLTNETEFQFLLAQLENHYLGNADPNIRFALLTDFPDAPEMWMPGEGDLLAEAQAAIQKLNGQYGLDGYAPFYYFHRERAWNESENCWMGWERKRGKLAEFNRMVRNQQSSFIVQVGDMAFLPSVRYVITLDADTILTRDSARSLIATIAHPLNRAEFDPRTGAITAGYTILQPRVQVRPVVANRSFFARIFSGDTVLDLYTRAVSDVYQDLFGEGSYVGKGIYDLAAFERSLAGRVPDNSLLSHDLFEGMQGRCGLATSVVLFEDYPPHYLAYAHRLHRWIRGDWQLLPWLFPRVPHATRGKVANDLSGLDRWRLFDNLRRSLVSPGILLMLACAWLFLPGSAVFWTALALSPLALDVSLRLLASVRVRRADEPPAGGARPVQLAAWRAFFQVAFLPHEALVSLDAIPTTLVRVFISHKRLLEWATAAHVVRLFGRQLQMRTFWMEMIAAPLFALALLVLTAAIKPGVLVLAAPFLALWLISPAVATRISRPIHRAPQRLTASQLHRLRFLARSTWLYFEQFVGPDDHWLPPDHFQEDPRGLVAHRTSPTNIGLLLLSTLAAHDFGYVGSHELVLRLRSTLDGMDQLERQRGHLLNWYDTRTLSPLPPRYISTVDSGNLAACLLALRAGCRDAATRPVARWAGLVDTLDVLDDALSQAHLDSGAAELHEAIAALKAHAENLRDAEKLSPNLLQSFFEDSRTELEDLLVKVVESSAERLDSETLRRLSLWIERTRSHIFNIQRDLDALTPWALALADAPRPLGGSEQTPGLAAAWTELQSALLLWPALEQIPAVCTAGLEALSVLRAALSVRDKEAIAWCASLGRSLEIAASSAGHLLGDLEQIRQRAEAWFTEMNFGFLYDPQRRVFHIGYNVDMGRLDPNYYDLLASEARLTSLIAIAKGDVPQTHWLNMARPITQAGGERMLLSWSGTMFEYLMPTLLARSYPGTLLEQSCRAAVGRQIEYARSKRVPWGISESGYYYLDSNQAYQYRAFGVPELGYKRGLGEDLVIAPYASLLALPIEPHAVAQNLDELEKMGMIGSYGLYEAADFTAGRLATGRNFAIVRSYMAHHQGMILLSLGNYLNGEAMIRRFHADHRIETVQILLQEQTPHRAPIEHPHPHEIGRLHAIHSEVSLDPWPAWPSAAYPQVHFLSNGSYGVLISASGGGFSRWGGIDLTRWRSDPTLDGHGTWLYVRDRDSGRLWSAALQPTGVQPDNQAVRFYPHYAEFVRRDGDLTLRTRLNVLPDADVEIRRVTISNHGGTPRRLSLTSYGEVILNAQSADQRHPAFNKLFIESEYLEDGRILLLHRRPRSAQEKPVFLAHFAVNARNDLKVAGYETDRAAFLGRGGTARAPAALQVGGGDLSGTTGATLDPIFAVQVDVTVQSFESTQVAFVTLAAASRKEALALAERFSRWGEQARSVDQMSAGAREELVQMELDSPQLEQFQKLLSTLLYPNPALRAEEDLLVANSLGQPGLWPLSISGDYPILLVRVANEEGLPLVAELLRAHTYWRGRGLAIDLVILNQHETGYQQELQGKLYRLLARAKSDDWLNKRGGIFLVREDQLGPAERILLATAARVVLDGGAGTLPQQLQKLEHPPVLLPHFVPMRAPSEGGRVSSPVQRPSDLRFDNGLGGFTPDSREYVIHLQPGQWTPLPWSNVIANPGFGFLLTEAGLGCTWAGNSGENRLTPWRNDPVSDPPAEAIYLRDEDTGQVWSPTPLPARADSPYLIRHGMGYSTYSHHSHELQQDLKIFAVPDAPVKIAQLTLKNTSRHTRRVNVTYYAEWVLGTTREDTAPYIIPEFVTKNFALLVRNPYNLDFGKHVAFLASTRELHALTTDRTEFLGSLGSYERPAALERVGLTASTQAGGDPCTAMQVLLWLAPGEAKEVSFLLGQGADREQALELVARYQDLAHIDAAWEAVARLWEDMEGGIRAKTPDPGLDLLLNHWLPYQALSCRLWARTAFFQPGGAYGFRDQLQDVLAFLPTHPELAREHILRAARHQFEEGDVLHWWHPPQGRGVRTRITDNLIWLPFATAEYVSATGDGSILNEKIPFLTAEPLQKGEDERYGQFPTAAGPAQTLYEHCRRALARGLTSGPHGLPLMGAGDWNDGMNRVGAKGVGESVWLGWFLCATLAACADMCEELPGRNHAGEFRKQAETLRVALSNAAWDGAWFRRAYYDDGKPLGSMQNNDCQIDSISQSWAVISGAADPAQARQAMESLYARLVRHEDSLILLLAPPFDRTFRDPGYIKGYVPGIRENGGQYTHAALWAIWAFARLGEGDRAAELLRLINPVYLADTPEKVARYKVEPYVIAADVYSTPPHTGRGGWTWYTGSASWMHRLGVEMILGLRRRGGKLQIEPCIPKDWPGYEIDYRWGRSSYHIRVENPQGVNTGVKGLEMDGKKVKGKSILLKDDGLEHGVVVTLG
jgi:cyclic beta-1,2-glucan synthetase